MSYNVTIWSNTGFNVNNIPDSPALLGTGTTVQPIEVMQDRYLENIKISGLWDSVKDIDYCRVGSMYYIVTGVEMVATDVASLTLVPDFISSLGGVTHLEILDGITERCHLSNSVDGDKDDPLLAPQEALVLQYEVLHGTSAQGVSSKFTVIESSVDMAKTTAWPESVPYKSGVTELSEQYINTPKQQKLVKPKKTVFTTPIDVGSGVFVDQLHNRRDTCLEIVDCDTDVQGKINGDFTVNIPDQNGDTHKMGTSKMSVNKVGSGTESRFSLIDYNADYTAFVRSAGIESCIINKIEYPMSKVLVQSCYYDELPNFLKEVGGFPWEEELESAYPDYELTEIEKCDYLPSLSIKEISGVDYSQKSGIEFKYATANNDIINFSDYTPYGLLTAAGNKIETEPKNLVDDLHNVDDDDAPYVRCVSDPNPDGAPYYGYKKYLSSTAVVGFMARTVKGMSWKQVPIVFTEKSGRLFDTISHSTTEKIATNQYLANQALVIAQSATNSYFGGLEAQTIASSASTTWNAADASSAQTFNTLSHNRSRGTAQFKGALTPVVGGITQAVYNDWQYRQAMYEAGMNYAMSAVASPTLMFPYNSEPARDAIDNGVISYRMKYSQADIARIDKLITMYGVKTRRALTNTMFTSRRYFNYVMCNNVTLTGHSRYLDEGAALQLKGGVRIWHTKPDPAKYLTENI